MSTPTMKQIIEDTQRLIQVKTAEYKANVKQAAGMSTEGAGDDAPLTNASMVGSEDTPFEPEKQPMISSDATAEPSNGGAGTPTQPSDPGGGDDSPLTNADMLGAEDAPTKAEEKPLITGDAKAKEAGSLANSILESIRNAQTKAASAKKSEAEKEAASKCKKSESKPAKKVAKPEAEKGANDVFNMELTKDVLAKIASELLSTEEGVDFVESELAKKAGAEECHEILEFLAHQSELATKQAEAGKDVVEDLAEGLKEASAEDSQANAAIFYKFGQAMADAGLAEMAGGGDAGIDELMGAAGGEGMVPPEELGGEMGGADLGGADVPEDVTPEEVIAGLEELVADGTISEEEAVQAVQYMAEADTGGGEMPAEEAPVDAAPAEEAPVDAAPAEEAPAEAAPADDGEMEAEASAKSASDLLEAIRSIQKKK